MLVRLKDLSLARFRLSLSTVVVRGDKQRGPRMWACLIPVLVLSGHILSLQGKKVSFENQQVAATTAANVSDFFLTASIVTFILYMPKNSEDFFQFFSKLYPEGNQLFGPLLAIKKNHFWRNFLICNLCIGSLVSLNASFFLVNFGWSTYKYVIFRDLEFYMYNLLLLLLLALVRKLEMRFAELNELLEYKTEHFLKTNSNAKQNDDEAELDNRLSFILNSEHFYSVRTFRTMHYDLCRLVKRFNEMFGRIILSMIVFSIANILAKVTFIIDFYVTPRSEEEKHKWSLFVGIVCAWIFANLGQAYLFSYYGEQITKEGEKTTRTCFYLLNKVPFQTKNEDENLVQDELKLFALQSYSNIPFLSAGGFFDINFRVLGLVISSVTSYLMVIIQFLLRPQTS
ncbi:uncharacterized protein LOC126741385 [Anthonomus grandis grandis]|uniref:uncharacterized protein LOC126741385 n=1 Tax=Anthonomus grandis grandis TaxID=2921223 RepID=UPI002165D7C1|nr:uncharacterized protein LOC126741385 [Anthonomus grandis grandis]